MSAKGRALVLTAVAFAVGCGGGTPPPATATVAPGGTKDQNKWPADDRSLCEPVVHWRNNSELEVSETAGPGALRPNVRRVYKILGERENRHKVLICREIDTNLDGIKDVVRSFDAKGEALHEEADTNYDNKIDVWINFANGRMSEEDLDTTFANGRPNVWKFYVDGRLSRIRRNTHCPSGKPDTWEIYTNGHLDRVGNDTSCDTHVDRWDRDTDRLAALEQQEAAAAADAGTSPITVGASDAAAPVADAGKKKGK
jgi:hypothetical protein